MRLYPRALSPWRYGGGCERRPCRSHAPRDPRPGGGTAYLRDPVHRTQAGRRRLPCVAGCRPAAHAQCRTSGKPPLGHSSRAPVPGWGAFQPVEPQDSGLLFRVPAPVRRAGRQPSDLHPVRAGAVVCGSGLCGQRPGRPAGRGLIHLVACQPAGPDLVVPLQRCGAACARAAPGAGTPALGPGGSVPQWRRRFARLKNILVTVRHRGHSSAWLYFRGKLPWHI